MTIWERWQSIPTSIREPIKSAIVAASLALQTAFLVLVGAAAQAGALGSPAELIHYIGSHWWGVAIGFVLPAAYRARQGSVAAASTVQLPSGAIAVITPPPKGT